MTGLHQVQSEFAAALLDTSHAVPCGVTSHTAPRPARRFAVYRNNVVASLIDVLQSHFPIVTRLVGEGFFRATAKCFIVDYPPRSPILSRYGALFPAFIQKFPPVQDLPYLADVARLEWLQQQAYHARDQVPLTASDLETISEARMQHITFDLHPSVGLLVSRFPVFSIWRTNTFDADVEAISLDGDGEAALVVRPRFDVQVVPLPPEAETFVALLMMGQTVRVAAIASLRINQHFSLQNSLAILIEAGAFADFDVMTDQRCRSGSDGNVQSRRWGIG
jgi:hypothetical protein